MAGKSVLFYLTYPWTVLSGKALEIFIMSQNGSYHGHPDDEALAHAVLVSPHAELVFNYGREGYRRWKAVSERDESEFTVSCGSDTEGVVVTVLPAR
jgi:hypothetical protein